MRFEPVNTNLNSLDEFKNLFHKITYTGYVGSVATNYPVTVTAVETNTTVNVSDDTISGYYSDSFDHDIHYRNKDDTFTTVHKFEQIDEEAMHGIYHYNADENRTKVYSYIASANGEQKTYTITVTNNWSSGRNQLLKYSNPTKYQEKVCVWVNNNSTIVPWNNTNNGTVTWENNT